MVLSLHEAPLEYKRHAPVLLLDPQVLHWHPSMASIALQLLQIGSNDPILLAPGSPS